MESKKWGPPIANDPVMGRYKSRERDLMSGEVKNHKEYREGYLLQF